VQWYFPLSVPWIWLRDLMRSKL